MIKMAMVQEIRVRDVMSPAVATLPASCTVRQATQVLFDARVSGAPVVGSGERVLGVVSHSDLLDPRHDDAPDTPILDVMTRVVFAVRADDPLVWAIRLMVEERVHRVIVADDAGQLVGVVVPMDVLRVMVPESPLPSSLEYSYVDLRGDEP
ncbi:MAG: CBS domain-containing protein [Polyangiaceae bacterium]|nr:CBS domain-containing protein [Polyangiaceae bacterium]